MTITIQGVVYPTSPTFQAETEALHPDLLTTSYEALEAERDVLMKLSTDRHTFRAPTPSGPLAPGGTLTVAEYDRLQAIVRTMNVHHGVNFLQGRPHTDFGFEGVDQVHGNLLHLDCGCIHAVVFDHHQRHVRPPVHEHYPRRLCEDHKATA